MEWRDECACQLEEAVNCRIQRVYEVANVLSRDVGERNSIRFDEFLWWDDLEVSCNGSVARGAFFVSSMQP